MSDPKRSGLYSITNTVNGKAYIGSAVDISVRWMHHRADLRRGVHHSPYLQNSWIKYGEPAFTFSVLEYVENKEDLISREQFYIDNHQAADREHGYNVRKTAGSFLGMTHSPETRAKMAASAALRGPRS